MDWANSYYTMSDENNYTIWGFLKHCWQKRLDLSRPRRHALVPALRHGHLRHGDQRGALEGRSTPASMCASRWWTVQTSICWSGRRLPGHSRPMSPPPSIRPELRQGRAGWRVLLPLHQRCGAASCKKLQGHEHGEAKVVGDLEGQRSAGLALQSARSTSCPPGRRPKREHRVIAWDEVSAAEGTGIVHIAPGCGREDFALAKDNALAAVWRRWMRAASISDGYGWLTRHARLRGSASRSSTICAGRAISTRPRVYKHVYPHCWRCGTELIFRLVDEWFISMGSLEAPGDNLRKRLVRIVEDPEMTGSPASDASASWTGCATWKTG